jgi:SAM-dependent methyltransferase
MQPPTERNPWTFDMDAFLTLKWLLFPGVNLHARQRFNALPKHFGSPKNGEARYVLDAGCGNGMLSYQSYLRQNRVLGISFKQHEVDGCRQLFNAYLGIPEETLRFENGNLYALDHPDESFDEIICTEVLEHIKDDSKICRTFWRLLKPSGTLHITAPNAEHPYNVTFPIDHGEGGGHVRPGYTFEEYRRLLEPIGFRIVASAGLGGAIRQGFNRRIKETQARFGAASGMPLFLLALPFLLLEGRREPNVPFSVYVKALKPEPNAAN